jgi:hypothetical protein
MLGVYIDHVHLCCTDLAYLMSEVTLTCRPAAEVEQVIARRGAVEAQKLRAICLPPWLQRSKCTRSKGEHARGKSESGAMQSLWLLSHTSRACNRCRWRAMARQLSCHAVSGVIILDECRRVGPVEQR